MDKYFKLSVLGVAVGFLGLGLSVLQLELLGKIVVLIGFVLAFVGVFAGQYNAIRDKSRDD